MRPEPVEGPVPVPNQWAQPRSAIKIAKQPGPWPSSGVDVSACGEVLPGFDGVESGCGEPAVDAECIVA